VSGLRATDVAWSPDGSKLAIISSEPTGTAEVFTMNPDGSDLTEVTNTPGVEETSVNWQPLPVNGYPRPKAATPMFMPMVPAYEPCGTPNRTHAPPLSHPSCNPPQQTSTRLTVGTPDANMKPVASTGSVRFRVINDIGGTPADEADLALTVNVTDVRERSDLTDYLGELRMQASVRATDKLNTPHPGGPGPATLVDARYGPSVPCAGTADPNIGSTCSIDTTTNALIPGLIKGGARSLWQFGQIELYDGGSDGDGGTTADNTLFMQQGVFIP
jgi:hypothetical protein